jgi:hypothetical protein
LFIFLQVGVGSNYNYTELQGIASAPASSNVLNVANFSVFSSGIASSVAGILCESRSVSFVMNSVGAFVHSACENLSGLLKEHYV